MKASLNLTLLKGLINSDFLISQKKWNFKGSHRDIKMNLLVSKKVPFGNELVLDPVNTLKSIKQYIRLIQFLSRQPNPNLNFSIENKQHKEIIEIFLLEYKNSFLLPTTILSQNTATSSNTTSLLIDLNSQLSSSKILQHLVEKNIFLINKINTNLEKRQFGTYKIYNDISNFQKLTFLLALTNQCCNQKK